MVRVLRTVLLLMLALCLALGLSCCSGSSASAEDQDATGSGAGAAPLPVLQTQEKPEEETEMKLWIGETEVPVSWEENDSVEAIKELLPLTIQMSPYGGFEQVGPIGQSVTKNDRQTTTHPGDIVLYSGNQIVVFYGSNSWAYTMLGHIDLTREELADLLGSEAVTLKLE
ncbi:MAG: hypothetical protein IKW92_00430 [Firmicutes bacterium]|nr:hypothetical protein [Bacillota bacterium]